MYSAFASNQFRFRFLHSFFIIHFHQNWWQRATALSFPVAHCNSVASSLSCHHPLTVSVIVFITNVNGVNFIYDVSFSLSMEKTARASHGNICCLCIHFCKLEHVTQCFCNADINKQKDIPCIFKIDEQTMQYICVITHTVGNKKNCAHISFLDIFAKITTKLIVQ